LNVNFGTSLQFLDPTVTTLNPGTSTTLSFNGNTTIPIFLDGHVRLYNWEKSTEYYQFIISSEPLANIRELALEGLPTPSTLKKKGESRGSGGNDEEIESTKAAAWTTQQLTVDFINPEHNTVRESELNLMLADEDLAEFAVGVYFDAITNALNPELKLKENIQLRQTNDQLDERGLIRDGMLKVANSIARSLRNRHYRIMVERFPNKRRIVSEGDSWFQHPLVTDTIDHLGKSYPIYCVAAAGDTLKNYDKEGEWIKVVKEKQPSFFLISGGGNDILGEQFEHYIKKGPHASGLTPDKYLEPTLLIELDSLKGVYEKMFKELFAVRPDIHVLFHGYDYIIPLESTKKGWLGRYMIKKGMKSQSDRKAVLTYILDQFNARIKAVAEKFPGKVHYINARGLVRDNQWYDEIHPDKEGFGAVAGKFLEKIDAL